MARMGVFSRNDDTPENIPRSRQVLTHRKTFDAKYMEIYPNFCQVLQPNESLRLRVTNFARTIPMVTPQLTRVRLVQRFYAVPFRIMWRPWENWIKGSDDAQFQYELPWLANMNLNSSGLSALSDKYLGGYATGFAVWSSGLLTGSGLDPKSLRTLTLDSTGYFSYRGSSDFALNLGVHELGDYLGYPLFSIMGKTHDGKFLVPHAFKACAYQMCYSYGYRNPNVQTRIDDFRELAVNSVSSYGVYGNHQEWHWQELDYGSLDDFKASKEFLKSEASQSIEFPSTFAVVKTDSGLGPGSIQPDTFSQPVNGFVSVWNSKRDMILSSNRDDIIRTSWDNVEQFPLRAGPNVCLMAEDVDPVTGFSVYKESSIALFRMRSANWQTDYFTSSNPWQQRGDEAHIPVVGSVQIDLSGISATSTFSGISERSDIRVGSHGDSVWISVHPQTIPPHGYGPDGVGVWNGSLSPQVISNGDDDHVHVEFTPKGNVSTSIKPFSSKVDVSGLYVSPSAFRFAMALQHVKELQAQTDNRYKSYMRKIFGAPIADNRIDRPEFLGGFTQELNVSEVVQQSSGTADGDSPLGTLAGRGVSARTSRPISFYAREHTVVIGLLHIVPDTLYAQGLEREDNVHDRFDFPIPQFGRLSENPVYYYELSLKPMLNKINSLDYDQSNFTVFGYEPVYNDLRWKRNSVHGAFRDFINMTGNFEWYKPWIFVRDFGFSVNFTSKYVVFDSVSPTLSDEFLNGKYGCDYSNFVVTDPRKMYPFIVDSYFDLNMTRIIPTRGLPSKY